MEQRRGGGRRKPQGVPWNERVVIDEFDRDAQVTLAFRNGPSVTAFLPTVPRAGELLKATRWGRKWRTEGQFRVREVEWQYEGRVPGRVVVHLEQEAQWRARRAATFNVRRGPPSGTRRRSGPPGRPSVGFP